MSSVVVHAQLEYGPVRYFWLRDEKRTPLGCIAYRFLSTPGGPLSLPVRWGWSVLNLGLSWSEKTNWRDHDLFPTKLDQFDRRLGRTIAEGRLNDPSPRVAVSVSDIFDQIQEDHDQFPFRIRLAAAHAYVQATSHGQHPEQFHSLPGFANG